MKKKIANIYGNSDQISKHRRRFHDFLSLMWVFTVSMKSFWSYGNCVGTGKVIANALLFYAVQALC